MLDCADIGSLEMLVLTNEIIGMARRVTRGIEVNDLTLMLDLIDEVGPGGEFMTAKETSKLLRKETWMSKLMDRQPWEVWEAAGQPSLSKSVRNRVKTILAEHQPVPLPDGAAERIEQILQQAEERTARN
jgi:trimethylamine--corrinoid protein Co-methyltransferase